MRETSPVAILFYTVLDPQAAIEECPAITTLLYKVLGQETTKFDEAVRLIELFMVAAYEKGYNEGVAYSEAGEDL